MVNELTPAMHSVRGASRKSCAASELPRVKVRFFYPLQHFPKAGCVYRLALFMLAYQLMVCSIQALVGELGFGHTLYCAYTLQCIVR